MYIFISLHVAYMYYKISLWRPFPNSSRYSFWLSYMYKHNHTLCYHIITDFILFLSSFLFQIYWIRMIYLINYLLIISILVFDIWSTYMCPVTEKILPLSPDLLHRWTIIHLFKLRVTPISPVRTHTMGFYATLFPYYSEIRRCG